MSGKDDKEEVLERFIVEPKGEAIHVDLSDKGIGRGKSLNSFTGPYDVGVQSIALSARIDGGVILAPKSPQQTLKERVEIRTDNQVTAATVSLGRSGFDANFRPGLIIEPPIGVVHLLALRFPFDGQPPEVRTTSSGFFDKQPEVRAGILNRLENLRNTPLGARGYDPAADPNLLKTFSEVPNALSSGPATKQEGDPLRWLSQTRVIQLSVNLQLRKRMTRGDNEGRLVVFEGSSVTLNIKCEAEAQRLRNVIRSGYRQGIVDATRLDEILIEPTGAFIMINDEEIAQLDSVRISPAGAATTSFTMMGTAEKVNSVEALVVGAVSAFGAMLEMGRGATRQQLSLAGAAGFQKGVQHKPVIAESFLRAEIQPVLTRAVREFIWESLLKIPGVDLSKWFPTIDLTREK